MRDTAGLSWPVSRLSELLEGLARAGGLSTNGPIQVAADHAVEDLDVEMERLTRAIRIEADSSAVSYADVDQTITTASPGVFVVGPDDAAMVFGVIDGTRRRVTLLAPSGRRVRLPRAEAVALVRGPLATNATGDLDERLINAGLSSRARSAALGAIVDARLAPTTVARCWTLRSGPDVSYWQQLREAKLLRRLVAFGVSYAGAVLSSIAAWWVLGAATFEGRLDAGPLLAWTFLLLTLVPFALLSLWSQGVFMVGASGLLKLRLLTGALRLDPDETRHDGVGRHLARVIESASLEALALSGGFATVGALFDLTLAASILVAARDWITLVVATVAIGVLVITGIVYVRRRAGWTESRVSLTQDLVERMVGHRTRLVQESHAERHGSEDATLDVYGEQSRRMDRWGLLMSVVPRLWLLAGVLSLGSRLAEGSTAMATLAVSLGAILLVYAALAKLSGGFSALVDAGISWAQIRPLLRTFWRREPAGDPDASAPADVASSAAGRPFIVGRDLAYSFAGRNDSVLSKCSFQIASGDRIHLSGPSGGGKSTLVSLLTGLRTPSSGLLLANGLDRDTMGAAIWRRRVAAAPQFHDNFVFNDSLAFNLLLGRRWPPTPEDLQDADAMCRTLHLGDLIDRMPAGLQQVVGENGWQLSHGERSRVFMARALLQRADLVVLDESFAELDPDSLRSCLPAAAAAAKTFLVVAHA